MSMEAQTSRIGSQDFPQGSKSAHEGHTLSVGSTDTVSAQQLFAEMRKVSDGIVANQLEIKELAKEVKKMSDGIVVNQLEMPKMEARFTKLVTDSIKDLIKEATKNKEDLIKEATKNKEDLTREATKNKEDLTRLVTDTEGRLNKEVSKVAISHAKIFATATAGTAIIMGVLAILRIPSFIFGSS